MMNDELTHPHFTTDAATLGELLELARDVALRHVGALANQPVAARHPGVGGEALTREGVGAKGALEAFLRSYGASMNASAGPRYLGYVVGGTTPAALLGDWLVSAFDQNVFAAADSGAPFLERSALSMLRALVGLSGAHQGSFVTGATMSNFVGLAVGRQWAARQLGGDAARSGLQGLPAVRLLSGAPHSSVYKAAAMLGLGRDSVTLVPRLPGREAVDVRALEAALVEQRGLPCLVVANAGTVNTVDFDDLVAIARLRESYPFWLHVDAAFGAFAALSPRTAHLVAGLDAADSVAVDAHKWLNVPYDAAVQFTRHPELQVEVFQNGHAPYLDATGAETAFMHLTPENSRRFRALPTWFTLMAYGSDGYQEVVERNVALARELGRRVEASAEFRLLAPVRLNVTAFTLRGHAVEQSAVTQFLRRLEADGRTFLTPTVLDGVPGIRAAWSNWRTDAHDLEIVWEAMLTAARTA